MLIAQVAVRCGNAEVNPSVWQFMVEYSRNLYSSAIERRLCVLRRIKTLCEMTLYVGIKCVGNNIAGYASDTTVCN
jgi:hypothetical protein